MADGIGDGTAKATFTFDGGETVLISRDRPSGEPGMDQTFLEVRGGDGKWREPKAKPAVITPTSTVKPLVTQVAVPAAKIADVKKP